jgi:hypothetical protein
VNSLIDLPEKGGIDALRPVIELLFSGATPLGMPAPGLAGPDEAVAFAGVSRERRGLHAVPAEATIMSLLVCPLEQLSCRYKEPCIQGQRPGIYQPRAKPWVDIDEQA